MSQDRKSKTENRKPSESYTVLARRYRPQQFADIVGQEPVARALVNALESNRVAHAYLFTGARGVGKTSTARILAKALNCVKGPTPTPCDECGNCRSIATGDDIDVLEIDAASNRGIDEVREIRSNVRSRPSGRSRYKIYIIDEVHMLTREAFNALLKTLEEPPPHVKFIFATTEVQKIPVTILSRCQRFDFAGISTSRIVERLREVVKAEEMKADDDALELVARRAAGSMRDAQSLLDQLLAFGGERVAAEQVHALLGTANDDRVVELAGAVLSHEPKRALESLAVSVEEGAQVGELLDQLIDYWRDLMVVNCAGAETHDLNVAPRHRDTLFRQAASLSIDAILAGLEILSTTKSRLRGSNYGHLLLEMALVRLSCLEDLVSLAQLAAQLSGAATAERKADSTEQRTPETAALRGPRSGLSAAPAAALDPVKKKPAAVEPEPLTADSLPRIWPEVLTQIGSLLASEIKRAGVPAISGPNTLVLRFPPEYNQQREHCQEPSRLALLEQALRDLTGQPCSIRVESGNGASRPQAVKTETGTENAHSRYRRPRDEAEQEPLVRRAIDVLGAQVIRMDDGFGASAVAVPERAAEAVGGES